MLHSSSPTRGQWIELSNKPQQLSEGLLVGDATPGTPSTPRFPFLPSKGPSNWQKHVASRSSPSSSSFCSYQAQKQVQHLAQGLLALSAKFQQHWRAAACSVSELVWNQRPLQGAFADAEGEQSLSISCATNINTALICATPRTAHKDTGNTSAKAGICIQWCYGPFPPEHITAG